MLTFLPALQVFVDDGGFEFFHGHAAVPQRACLYAAGFGGGEGLGGYGVRIEHEGFVARDIAGEGLAAPEEAAVEGVGEERALAVGAVYVQFQYAGAWCVAGFLIGGVDDHVEVHAARGIRVEAGAGQVEIGAEVVSTVPADEAVGFVVLVEAVLREDGMAGEQDGAVFGFAVYGAFHQHGFFLGGLGFFEFLGV